MSKYELIAFDMDGTLLDSNKKVRKDSLDMIQKAVDAGKIVTLSTGRCLPELQAFREELKALQYIICVSGALVLDSRTNQEIFSRSIPKDTARQVLQAVRDIDLMPHFLSKQSIVQKDQVCRMDEYNMGVYQTMFEKVTVKPDDIFTYFEENTIPMYKLNLYCRNLEDRARLKEELSPLPLTLAYSEETSLECSPLSVSKGEGLQQLCNYLHIPVEKAIAVGDADNDLDILKQAGLAVAMGNANENVKKIADVIVKDNDHGGCAQAIAEYLMA